MTRTALFGAIAAAMASSPLLAEMNYTYLELSLVDLEVGQGPFNVDGNGFEVAGAYEFNDTLFVFGEWQDQDLDFGVNGRQLEVGAGLVYPINDKLDFVGQLSYLDAELKAGGITASDDGLALSGGIRALVTDAVQLDASIKHIAFDDSDTGFSFGGRYYFNPTMAVGASADFYDNADTLRIGFRWEF
jgi:hypothetical protein